MARTSVAAFYDKLLAPEQFVRGGKTNNSSTAGALQSLWTVSPLAGVTPTTSIQCTRATAGAIGQYGAAVGPLRIGRIEFTPSLYGGVVYLLDRLVQSGGLSGTVTTAQTTNLPTAALPRYTDGVGVMPALEVHASIGTTSADVTISYTNHAGVSGRTSKAVQIGASGYNTVTRFIVPTLLPSDLGCRSVESVTLGGSTGSVGAFGVVLFKPLLALPVTNTFGLPMTFDALVDLGMLPEIANDACLMWAQQSQTTSLGAFSYEMLLIED